MGRRTNSREAKIAMRKAALADDLKPVHGGLEGGQYRPLTDIDIAAINDNVFKILAEVGFADATPHCIETCVAIGATYSEEDGRLRFPKAVVEDAMDKCCRDLTLYGQDPKHDVHFRRKI